ncbi:hypothetical protein [Novosphingobium sp. SG720]|uniref:hypothetical protein n=1 Tax=Novosphingobium sp. SG720 TaxID=2586998 RepID=UPI001445D34A|nr:hypothetical protein [Novosphingobium sp. SG720]NKJ43057.1 hypothetical protein [Novosphingobium sp. SG720]
MILPNQTHVEIVPAHARHVGFLARHMRAIDKAECRAMGREPKAALRHGLIASTHCWTAMVAGRPHAMFGVVVESALAGRGVPWFLGTNEVWRHGRTLLRLGPPILAAMHDSSAVLANLVSTGNTRAIRLLERWGFTVDEDTMLVGDLAFRRFARRRPALSTLQQENA